MRHASPVLLAGALLAFALPFATVSCEEEGSRTQVRPSGIELATFSVPPARVSHFSADGAIRHSTKVDPAMSAQVEDEASGVALIALTAIVLGLLFGIADLAGASMKATGRGGFVCSAIALGAFGYLWQTARDAGAELDAGFWLASSFVGATLVVHGSMWPLLGGRLRELAAVRFAAGVLVALSWATTIWWLDEAFLGELWIGASAAVFITGLAMAGLAAAAMPAAPRRRLLFAASAPFVIVLSAVPLLLPVIGILGLGLYRLVRRTASTPTDDRLVAALLIASAWAFSIWWFVTKELEFTLDEPVDPRWSAAIFALAVTVGAVAGAAAPARPDRRLLLAAAAPVSIFLSERALLLPIVAMLAVGFYRLVVRPRQRDGPAGATAARAAPSPSDLDEPLLHVPRTQIVMLVGAAGFLLGPAVIYADRISWSPDTVRFVKNGPFQLWTAILGAQTLLWVVAFRPLLGSLRRHLRGRSSLRREVLPSAAILVLLIVAIVAVPAVSDPFPAFIPHMHLKVRFLTAGALIMALLASTSIWLIRARVERLAGASATRDTLDTYCRLRRELDLLLGFLGGVIGLAVLGSALLRKILLLYAEEPGVEAVLFPAESVILYGLVLSFVLALVYVPTYATFHRVGITLRNASAPFPEPDDLEEGLKRRDALDELLGLRLSTTASFRIATALLSPLIGSVVGVLPTLSG